MLRNEHSLILVTGRRKKTMLNIAKDMGTAQGINKDLLYEATVVNNDDSKSEDGRRLCRIKARIGGLFDGIPDADLPWAVPSLDHADGASSTSGTNDIPKVGTKVLLKFQNGSSDHPIYTGYVVDITTALQEMIHNYPNRKVSRYQNNLLIVVDTQTNEIFIRNPGNFNLFIEGNVNIEVTGNVVEKVLGNKTVYVKGNLTEIVDGSREVHVKGSNVQSVGSTNTMHAVGADTYSSDSTILRTAPYINDDFPMGGAPASPPVPVLEAWPGIRGNLPS